MAERGLLSAEQAAERLGVTNRTVRNMIERGRFPHAYRIDPDNERSPWKIPVEDVELILRKRQGQFGQAEEKD